MVIVSTWSLHLEDIMRLTTMDYYHTCATPVQKALLTIMASKVTNRTTTTDSTDTSVESAKKSLSKNMAQLRMSSSILTNQVTGAWGVYWNFSVSKPE